MRRVDEQEWIQVGRNLLNHHSIFYTMWETGRPYYNDKIPTMACQFSKYGDKVWFIVNPEFWDNMTMYEKTFVVGHECLHIIFEYWERMKDFEQKHIANMAADIVINHTLVQSFGFDRQRMSNAEDMCWLDKFECLEPYWDKSLKSSEFYYDKLLESAEKIEIPSICFGIGEEVDGDCPPGMEGDAGDEEEQEKRAKRYRKNIMDQLSEEDARDLQRRVSGKHAGDEFMDKIREILVRPSHNNKWVDLVKEWITPKEDDPEQQWATEDRRLLLMEPGLFLPSDYDKDNNRPSKVTMWLFIDSSGSCSSLVDPFVQAAASIPDFRFEKRIFGFSTEAYETEILDGQVELRGFGGTCFQCIDRMVNAQLDAGFKHPDMVWVFTDGHGTEVTPNKPDKWHWFLTSGGSDHCIPDTCNIHRLRDYAKQDV